MRSPRAVAMLPCGPDLLQLSPCYSPALCGRRPTTHHCRTLLRSPMAAPRPPLARPPARTVRRPPTQYITSDSQSSIYAPSPIGLQPPPSHRPHHALPVVRRPRPLPMRHHPLPPPFVSSATAVVHPSPNASGPAPSPCRLAGMLFPSLLLVVMLGIKRPILQTVKIPWVVTSRVRRSKGACMCGSVPSPRRPRQLACLHAMCGDRRLCASPQK